MDTRKNDRVARQRLIVQLILCVLLPPIGMILVWRSRYPRRGKLVLSLLSSLILTFMISFALSTRPPEDIAPTPMSATYANTDTGAGVVPGTVPQNPADPIPTTPTVAPANPFAG